MEFGPYPEGHCFHIENSPAYVAIQNGVKIAELILLKNRNNENSKLLIIEAKSSSPRQESAEDFKKYAEEIKSKLANGLLLLTSLQLSRHPNFNNELPEIFKKIDISTAQYSFVLIVNGHKKEWLPQLQEAISSALLPIIKIWNVTQPAVAVLNHELAEEKGICRAIPPEPMNSNA